MDEARDIVKLALPFAAGILTISCLQLSHRHVSEMAFLSSAAVAAAMIHLLYCIERRKPVHISAILAMAFMAGVLVRATGDILDISRPATPGILEAADRLGRLMQESIDRIPFADSTTNAVIKALLTGERSDIPKEITAAFRNSGASHILALSGLHSGIIYLVISRLLSVLGNTRRAKVCRSLIIVLLCTAYSLATGAGASIMRALIFIIIRETALMTYRKADLKTVFAGSLLIHLALFPQDASSVGFQLSYAAIAGIAWIHPHLKAMWPDDGDSVPIMKRVWESASVSISCQLTTGPLAWFYFGTFPKYFILTNLIAIPLTSAIIPAALLTVLLSGMGICPEILVTATETAVEHLCSALEIISGM